jgi:formate-dependent nitrite reductase membrane component NrfD
MSKRRGERALVPDVEVRTYYDRSVLKPPTWKHWIADYFFLGGLSAGSSLLAFGATLTGRRVLARRARMAAVTAIAAGSGALVADLGRPERFANMLRVAKVTSPMSVGSWLLSAYGPAAGIAAGTDILGVFPRLGLAAEGLAAALAPAISTYTAVLVADTSVPAWHEARGELPFLFAASASASAGGLGLVLAPVRENGPARRIAIAGAIGELLASTVMERRLGALAQPYREGRAGMLSKGARACTLAGAGAGLVRRRRSGAVASGALLLAGSLLERFAVLEAGRQSAADPKYVVKQQRERLSASGGDAAPVHASKR